MVLACILLVVAVLSVVSVFRQIRFKNFLALGFSVVSALTFGFFSVATIFCQFSNSALCAA